jgi:hypothetical protein
LAAKDFTAAEHGTEKFKYSCHKVIWELIASLVWSGQQQLPLTEFMQYLAQVRPSPTSLTN